MTLEICSTLISGESLLIVKNLCAVSYFYNLSQFCSVYGYLTLCSHNYIYPLPQWLWSREIWPIYKPLLKEKKKILIRASQQPLLSGSQGLIRYSLEMAPLQNPQTYTNASCLTLCLGEWLIYQTLPRFHCNPAEWHLTSCSKQYDL